MLVALQIIEFLGALALFIYGMKQMSGGIQKAAGAPLRKITQQITRNKYLAFLTGFLVTGIVQSSSAVTVMTVSFVNAGLLSLVESAGVILGANVGTTVTGWLISILEFKIRLHQLSLPLIAISVPLLFSRTGKLRYWGEFILGFALLFFGLSLMRELMPNFSEDPESLQFLKDYAGYGIGSAFIFMIIGIVLTFIVQSSSAAMALTMVMCSNGWLSYDIAAAMILGENIGTTVTAELAALVGNVHAKRSARIHTLFNILGTILFFPFLPVILPALDWFLASSFQLQAPAQHPENIPIALSAFHTTFNIVNAMIFLPLIGWLVKAAEYTVRSKGKKDDQFQLDYMPSTIKTSELSVLEVKKEVQKFADIIKRMGHFNAELLFQTDPDEQIALFKKVKKYEKISDRINLELIQYLTRLAQEENTRETSVQIRNYLSVCSDLERIGDLYYSLSKTIKTKMRERIWFNQHQRNRLKELFKFIDDSFANLILLIQAVEKDPVLYERLRQTEKLIRKKCAEIREENLMELYPDEFNVQSAYIYTNLAGVLEEVNEHVRNINEILYK